ncbi:uncharacterized protein ACHE_11486S [Aspergillus chevalieri]|uniref:Uncharacterized protein n=1 Tax=Aspergillus chevalieri TaxID=182096 RepID=A0A7R7VHY7_ASPCH|nr:uncharacterized protein ACHE_11486S [Aspergillus chevalieri]BCR84084.1 hypothetical protein ACHE_11486S [Aspergillus chevalieri]
MQGGYNSFLIPVNQAAQNSQGGTINGFYRRHGIEENSCDSDKSWFTIDKWDGNLGPYCHALQHGSPQEEKDICKKGSKDAVGPRGFDVGEYAYKWDGGAYHPAGKNK